jgi:hypothetical protein
VHCFQSSGSSYDSVRVADIVKCCLYNRNSMRINLLSIITTNQDHFGLVSVGARSRKEELGNAATSYEVSAAHSLCGVSPSALQPPPHFREEPCQAPSSMSVHMLSAFVKLLSQVKLSTSTKSYYTANKQLYMGHQLRRPYARWQLLHITYSNIPYQLKKSTLSKSRLLDCLTCAKVFQRILPSC